jgi:hypothetical protein
MTAIYTTAHEGETATRKSADHIEQQYHFAIWAKWDNGWSCEAYSSRRDLAAKRASEVAQYRGVSQTAIEPVTCTIKLTKKQKAWVEARQQAEEGA